MFCAVKRHFAFKTVFKRCRISRFCAGTEINIVKDLCNILGDEQLVLSDNIDILPYATDWLGAYRGGGFVVFPTNTQQVSEILQYCNNNSLCIVPQGGNTGLVGGGIGRTSSNDIILSMKKMNKIIEIDSDTSAIVCEAGCVLEDLEKYANLNGNFSVPLDLGSKGSCMIGGCVSSNAGGLRVLRYGSMHHNVLGLEVVLPDGKVVNMLRKLRKDNAGYQLKHLFIGAEGTLGVVTKVSMQLVAKPTSVHTLLIKVSSFLDVTLLLQLARCKLGEILSAFEYMDQSCIDALLEVFPELRSTISNGDIQEGKDNCSSVYVLIETSGYHETNDLDRINEFSELLLQGVHLNDGVLHVLDATLAQDLYQISNMWRIRENIPIALAQLTKPKPEWKPEPDNTPSPPSSPSSPNSSSLNSSSPSSSSSSVNVTSPTSGITTNNNNYKCRVIGLHKLFKYDISLVCTDMVLAVDAVVCGLRALNYEVCYHPMVGMKSNSVSTSQSIPIVSNLGGVVEKEEKASDVYKYVTHIASSIPISTASNGSDIIEPDSKCKHKPKLRLEVFNYGHIGDNNLHLNILLRPQAVAVQPQPQPNPHPNSVKSNSNTYIDIELNDMETIINTTASVVDMDTDSFTDSLLHIIHDDIDQLVYQQVISKNGSISAEHGIGQLKSVGLILAKGNSITKNIRNSDKNMGDNEINMKFEKSTESGTGELDVMKTMKTALDPKNTMNPGKIFY